LRRLGEAMQSDNPLDFSYEEYFLNKRRHDMAATDTTSLAAAKVMEALNAPYDRKPVHDLLSKVNDLTQQLGSLSTLAIAVGNYSLASKALKYAKGLIESSDEVVRGLESGE
jgi:hypothetical protein